MSDGVELAVDIYLPPNYSPSINNENNGLPTFLHLTRYHRAEKRTWWASLFALFGEPATDYLPVRSLQYLQAFVGEGSYALVSVDVRGTGASFGSRPVDLIPREIQDYVEVALWVRNQPWCNGKIGTGGISYDGIAGALMAAASPPQTIQAVAMMFAPGDIFEDIAIPGGIMNTGFLEWYSEFTRASERNVAVNDPVIAPLRHVLINLDEGLVDIRIIQGFD